MLSQDQEEPEALKACSGTSASPTDDSEEKGDGAINKGLGGTKQEKAARAGGPEDHGHGT